MPDISRKLGKPRGEHVGEESFFGRKNKITTLPEQGGGDKDKNVNEILGEEKKEYEQPGRGKRI